MTYTVKDIVKYIEHFAKVCVFICDSKDLYIYDRVNFSELMAEDGILNRSVYDFIYRMDKEECTHIFNIYLEPIK